ncbi:hypothetical protein BGW42_006665 [Actinomortierella wolfii]|nr:hypothetical protein BGW42_006665 [Actinomortierella wolfii]
MEYAENGTLTRAIRPGCLNWELKKSITQQLICGVAYMHSKKILHRDIKSDNVLLTDDYRVAKLCDFGLAKLNRKPLTGTTTDAHVGTPLWKAPELFVEDPKYTKKTDVYSLGWVIWQMATNSIRPLEGTEVNEAIKKIKQGVRGDIPNDTPEEMRKPIESFWDHDASRRPEASSFIAKGTWVNEVEDDSFETIGLNTVDSYEGDFEQRDETLVSTTHTSTVGSSNYKHPKHPFSIPHTTRIDVPQSTAKNAIKQDARATGVSTKQQENAIHSLDVSQSQLPTQLDHHTSKSSKSSENSPPVEGPPMKVRVINIRRQAIADNMYAQFAFGMMFLNSRGALQSDFEALFWFKKAAERGHPGAQFRIGDMYERDKTLTKDINRAMHWYGKAANQGHQEAMQRLLALFPSRLRISPQQFQHSAIQDEVARIQRLRHLHLIQFYETHEHEGHVYFIMELAEKGSLSDVITSKKRLTWPTKTRITYQITRGLEYLHYKNVLHGFLKSSNVLLAKNMEAKLSDFGLPAIRSATSSDAPSFTFSSASIKNFVRWMAPELIHTSPHYSTKSDVYALGMVMWEMASHSVMPFENLENTIQVMLHVQQGGRENLPAETPRMYRSWVERCWERDPKKRPEANEIAEEANELLQEITEEVNEPPHEIDEEVNEPHHEITEEVKKTHKITEMVNAPLFEITEKVRD